MGTCSRQCRLLLPTRPPPPPAVAGAGGGDGGGERSLNGSAHLPLGAPSSPLPPLAGAASGHGGRDGGGGSTRQCGLPAQPPNPRQELEGIAQSTPILGSDTEMRLALTSGEGHFLVEDLVPEAHLMPAKAGLARLCRGRADTIVNTQTVSEMGRQGSDADDKRRQIVVGGRGALGHAVAAAMATVVKLLYNAFGAHYDVLDKHVIIARPSAARQMPQAAMGHLPAVGEVPELVVAYLSIEMHTIVHVLPDLFGSAAAPVTLSLPFFKATAVPERGCLLVRGDLLHAGDGNEQKRRLRRCIHVMLALCTSRPHRDYASHIALPRCE